MIHMERIAMVVLKVRNLEMQFIFEGTWIYLAHESQLPQPNDFYAITIGRQPVILIRDDNGEIGGFINSCPHRGGHYDSRPGAGRLGRSSSPARLYPSCQRTRQPQASTYFGFYEHVLRPDSDGLRIAKKKIILLNDEIETVLDINHL